MHGVRLHGSAASHVLHPESGLGYKDLDLVFRVDLRSEASFQLTKEVVLACLLDFLPAGVSRAKIDPRRESPVSPLHLCTQPPPAPQLPLHPSLPLLLPLPQPWVLSHSGS